MQLREIWNNVTDNFKPAFFSEIKLDTLLKLYNQTGYNFILAAMVKI